MLKCIEEEPNLILTIFNSRDKLCKDFVDLFTVNPIKKVYFSGQASGIFIGNMLKPFMENLLDVEVEVTNPANFLEHEKFNVNNVYKPNEMALLCPAHSGTTVGPIKMATQCVSIGIPVICTTYNKDSKLASLSSVVIDKLSGPEESFIETKGHIASLTILLLCIIETAKKKKKISNTEYLAYLNCFEKISSGMKTIIKDTNNWYLKNKSILLNSKVIRYIGFGPYYSVAQEGSLKIAEASGLSALVYEMEEFMHTSTTQINENSTIFILNPMTSESERMNELLFWCRDHCDNCIQVSNYNQYSNELSLNSTFQDNLYLSILEYLIPFQLIAFLLAKDLGISTINARNNGASSRLKTHVEE
ncbi:MAG: SIS domain-containing protein [Anaerorhabdus sp.]|uniref:SIS domain-containing protein n=1 Tax=Anaerorhabdus sp. TaxID=1872524 RepID=UPI002FC8AD7E